MKLVLLAFLSDTDELVPGSGPMGPVMRERLAIIGALVFVVLLVVGWIVFIRKRSRLVVRGSGHRHHHRHHSSLGKKAVKGMAEIKELVQESDRRRRRRHRPRNPTLAETGGLPPRREEGEPPPLPPPTPAA